MKKLQAIGRKMSAGILTVCLTVGMLAGTFTSGTAEQVSGAITGFTSNDFLKCYGTSIRNNYGNGNTVHLRGTNAGGLFVQESWMCSTNVRDQKTLMSNLKDRFGENQMYSLLDYYEDNYWTESDFDNCKNLGMSVIRVPFTYMNLYRYDSSKNDWVLRDNAFRKLDWFVEQCSQRGIYVILDLHGAFGSQNGQDHSGEVIDNVSDVTFFSNSYNKNKTLELWKTVAAHFANNPAVAAYDTLNEPGEKAGTTGEKHWNFYNEMYNTIRSVDPNHIIIMESCWGTSNLPNPQKYGWTNVMYEYHHYTWDYISDLDGQKKSCDNIINSINNANYGVPTYIGEFTCFGLEDAWNYVMNRFNEEGINYTSWSYKTNNSGSWGIYNEKNTNKVNPTSDSIDTIKNNWGANSIGTGNQSSNGMIYNSIKKAMPGTIVFANKALTDDDYIAIKAQISNKYVCADNNGQSNLVANRTSAGGWEQFRVINNSDGTVSFQSRANNKYLCAVFDDTDKENPVIARSNAIGTWEKFYAEKQSDGTYALKTYVDNYYVQADIDDATSGILHAYGASVGTWEKFLLEPASDKTEMPGQTDNPSVPETTVAPTTKSAETVPEGYTEATVNQWTPSGKWGCYFGNWSGTASGAYKWVSDADYNIYVDKANKGSAWLVQGSYTDNVTNGHTYKVTVDVTASKACSIGIKEDLSNEKEPQVYTDIPAKGTRTLTGTYTVTNNQIKVMFELGQNVDAGTNINFKNIKIEDLTVETTKEPTPTTVAPTTEAPTAIGPTTVVPTTTVAPTTVAPTTVVPTTAAPTTVAPTTVAPTTVAPTTVAPTTAAPTTEAPITTVAPTTTVDEDAVPTPIGLIYAGNETLPYYFIWQAPASDIESYNVYVDGKLVAASGTPSINLTADAFASGNGDYTVSVKSVRNGKESKATSITYTYTGGTVDKPTTVAPTTQSETSTAAIGEGSNAGKVDSEILNCRNDKDLAGSTFGKLCVKVKKSKKKAISLTWKNIQVAKTYVIYGAKCGTSYKKIATVHRKTFTNKKLKKGTYYKYMVVALNEKGKVVAISKLIHVATKGGKVGNCKKLKVNKSKVNLKQGKKFKLKVKQIAESKKVKLKKHRKIAFESDNQDVAVVSKKGIITAKKKGKCSVYVYAQNGVYKKIKIRVN